MGIINWLYTKEPEVVSAPVEEKLEPVALADNSSAAMEATFLSGPGKDPDEHLWQPMTSSGNLTRRQNLPQITQDQQIRLAVQFYKGNPIAKRSIQITAEYAVGDGIQYDAENEKVKEILDEHWSDTDNDWSIKSYERTRDLGLFGEQLIPAEPNPHNGHVKLGNIDPDLIETIVETKDDIGKTVAVILKKIGREPYRRAYKVIDVANVDNRSNLYGRLVGLPKTAKEAKDFGFKFKEGDVVETATFGTRFKAKWHGSCFYFSVNSPMGANRGFSDLLANMDWLDAHDQFLFSQLEKGIESAKYIWDITLEGATEQKIIDFLSKARAHKPGTRVAHNEAVKYEVQTPDLHLEDSTALANSIKNHILSGVGLPPVWFAESMTSRASAPEQTEPAYKSIGVRQRYIAFMMSRIFQYQIDESTRKGALKLTANESEAFYIKLPDVSAKDMRALGITIASMSTALSNAVEKELVTKERATLIFNRMLDQTGLDTWLMEETNPSGAGAVPLNGHLSNIFQKVTESKSGVMNGKQLNSGDSSLFVYNQKRHKNGKAPNPVTS